MEVGQKVPPFTVTDSQGNLFTEENLLGKKTLFFFYPKDNTSGCTAQACAFRDRLGEFEALGVRVIGVNVAPTHTKFIEQYQLNFPVLCDPKIELCQLFNVWKEKSMYGRKYMGIERSTFLIDDTGVVVWAERKVALPGHLDRIMHHLQREQHGVESR